MAEYRVKVEVTMIVVEYGDRDHADAEDEARAVVESKLGTGRYHGGRGNCRVEKIRAVPFSHRIGSGES
jgi:hypothetical protein